MGLFQALRKSLARRGVRLPAPYPYTDRALKGALMATLATTLLVLLGYGAWRTAAHTARTVQRRVFLTKESAVSVWAFLNRKSEEAAAKLFPGYLPPPPASLESILPPGSHLGNMTRAPIRRDALPYGEGTGTLTDAARQVDFALLQTVLRLGLDRGRVLLLSSDYLTRGKDIYHLQRMRIYLPPLGKEASPPSSPAGGETDVKGPPEPVFRFMNALAESLDAWADRAVLTESPGKLTLAVKGVLTHEIWIETTDKSFPILPPTDSAPRLTLVLDAMGADEAFTERALALGLPLTVAVLPFARDAAATAQAAHAAGQEILVDVPLESRQSPFVKAGPGEITTAMSEEDMRILLDDALRHVPYAVGASNHMGSRLTGDRAASRRFCEILARSGLYVLDDRTHEESLLYAEARRRGLPAWRRTLRLNDGPPSESAVLANLKKAEQAARAEGHAVVIGNPDPQTLAALKRWSEERDKAIRLVPLRLQPLEEETLTPDDVPAPTEETPPSVH